MKENRKSQILHFKYEIRRINFDGTNETVFYGDDEILTGMEAGTMQVDAVGRSVLENEMFRIQSIFFHGHLAICSSQIFVKVESMR